MPPRARAGSLATTTSDGEVAREARHTRPGVKDGTNPFLSTDRRAAFRSAPASYGLSSDAGTVKYLVARHISLRVPQPGSTGIVSADVSKSHVTSTRVSSATSMGDA